MGKTPYLVTRMAVCLSGLPALKPFDTAGEPAMLEQRWNIWKAEFELFCSALGVADPTQQRALLLHLAGIGVREIFKTIPTMTTGEAKDYKKAMDALTAHFKVKKNIPMSVKYSLLRRQTQGSVYTTLSLVYKPWRNTATTTTRKAIKFVTASSLLLRTNS